MLKMPHNVQQRWPGHLWPAKLRLLLRNHLSHFMWQETIFGKWSLANGILDESLRPTEIERKMVRWSQFGSDLDFLHLSGTFEPLAHPRSSGTDGSLPVQNMLLECLLSKPRRSFWHLPPRLHWFASQAQIPTKSRRLLIGQLFDFIAYSFPVKKPHWKTQLGPRTSFWEKMCRKDQLKFGDSIFTTFPEQTLS